MNKSGLSPIEKRIKKYIDKLFRGQETVSLVVGVSGGADSMCLMHVLNNLGIELHAVHVNYQKRGADAYKDAELVRQSAEELGIPCSVIEANPGEMQKGNFQQWARDLRYDVFDEIASEIHADGIAVAHHEDDQIETILQKLLRGSGLASWGGMEVWKRGIFRPLLHTSRQEIETYCKQFDIPFRTDSSNFDSGYARNFLRNTWLPEMQQHFPGWRTNVLRMQDEAAIFEASLRYILNSLTDKENRLNRKSFLNLENGLQKSVLLYYIKQIDQGHEISRDALKELSKLSDLQTGKSIQLTETISLMRDRAYMKLVVNREESGGFITLQKEELTKKKRAFNGVEFGIESFQNPNFKQKLYLDILSLRWPIHVRRWQQGDRFQPFGMEGHQTVAEHLTNRKVGAAEKKCAFVVESFEETICAVIFPPIENRVPPGTISDGMKCDPSTQICLTIKRI